MRATQVGWVLGCVAIGGCNSDVVERTSPLYPPDTDVPVAGVMAAGSGVVPAPASVGALAMSTRPAAGPGMVAAPAPSANPAADGGGAAPPVSAPAGKPAPAADGGGVGAPETGVVPATAGQPASAAGAPAPAAGSSAPAAVIFPKGDAINIQATGPYAVKTYTEGLDEPTYASSMLYYPEGAQPPFAVVAFTPGFTATKESYTFLGYMLASHGIAALLTTPTSTSDQPPARGTDLVAAVKRLKAENERSGSPVQGKLATDRICVTGHSMGGGGTLYAADQLGDMIRCAMPLQPWQPGGSFSKITAPTMIIGAASDTIAAVSSNAQPHYQSIPESTEKFLVVFEGDHYLSTNRTSTDQTAPEKATPSYDIQAAYIIPFYKLFLEDDERYRPYLYGDARSRSSVTRYEKSKL